MEVKLSGKIPVQSSGAVTVSSLWVICGEKDFQA
jgi:hypothetical protein